jgi:DNA-binding transcriptional ArsR family regulator
MVIQTQGLDDQQVDQIFRALADATRRDIVMRALTEDFSISALASEYDMSFPAVHKHVSVLERAGLVTKRREGRESIVRGNVDSIRRAAGLLDQFETVWRGRMDRIGDLLAADEEGDPT